MPNVALRSSSLITSQSVRRSTNRISKWTVLSCCRCCRLVTYLALLATLNTTCAPNWLKCLKPMKCTDEIPNSLGDPPWTPRSQCMSWRQALRSHWENRQAWWHLTDITYGLFVTIQCCQVAFFGAFCVYLFGMKRTLGQTWHCCEHRIMAQQHHLSGWQQPSREGVRHTQW